MGFGITCLGGVRTKLNLVAPPHPNIGHLPPSRHTVTNNGTKYKLLFIKMADGVMAIGFELFEMARCGTGVK